MRASYEHIPAADAGEQSFVAFVRENDTFEFNWHYHREIELTLILDSAGQRLVGNHIEAYNPGDLVLVGSNLPHTWRSDTPAWNGRPHRAVVVQFGADLLGKTFEQLPEFTRIARLLTQAEAGLAYPDTPATAEIRRLMTALPARPPARRLLTLLEVLVQLTETPGARPLSSPGFRPNLRRIDEQRIDCVCNHLARHLAEPIRQDELARRVRMNPAAFCRFFKQVTGRTLMTYVNEMRISQASQQLIETDANVTQIAMDVGYSSHAHFNRQFRRHMGLAPRDYRRQFRELLDAG